MKVRHLTEAPIEDLSLVGNFEKGSAFRHADDRKLLTNPKAIAKIKAKWANSRYPFVMFMVNNPEGRKNQHEQGLATEEWLAAQMPMTHAAIKDQLRDDAINILFNGNYGAERTPMTAWTIAHRFGHAVTKVNFVGLQHQQPHVPSMQEAKALLVQTCGTILNDFYGYAGRAPTALDRGGYVVAPSSAERRYGGLREQDTRLLRDFYHTIGTMRSAREGELRNEFEFQLELFAQYLLTGRIKFNPVPRMMPTGKAVFGRRSGVGFRGTEDDAAEANRMLSILANDLETTFDQALDSMVGQIFVM